MSQETMNLIFTSILVPILVALIPLAISFINLKAKEIRDRIGDAKLKKYVDIAEDAIESAVVAVMQTYVEALKGSEGWSAAARQKAFIDARTKAIIIMGTAARLAIKDAYGDFDTWLDSSIEYYVNKSKTTVLMPITENQ